MVDVLNAKRQEVVQTLIDRLSGKNSDYERCLNAHMILIELTDNDQLFGTLVDTGNVTKLINHACDMRNVN